MSNLFLVTSAIATPFGTGDRLTETLSTVESIRKRIDAEIWLLDSSTMPFDKKPVEEAVDRFITYQDTTTLNIVESGYGMNFVKSATECYMMRRALKEVAPTYGRVYKLSGRYRLNDQFVPHGGNNFTFLRPRQTGLPVSKTGTNAMIMTRLYSVAGNLIDALDFTLLEIYDYLWRVYSDGGVTDIEHGMNKYLPRRYVWFVDHIGVEGRIGHLQSEVQE